MTLQLIKSFFVWNELEQNVLSSKGDSALVVEHSSYPTVKFGKDKAKSIKLRVFKNPHPKGEKLPQLPIVVFIHGLGGQLNQFDPLLEFFSNFSATLAVDLPGHGQSEYKSDWDYYTPESFVDILETVLQTSAGEFQDVVIVGHSMGTILAVKLANRLGTRCRGVITVCPVAQIDPKLEKSKAMLGYLPPFIFDMFRAADRQGGLRSASVNRMVGDVEESRDVEVRTKQLRWNLQVRTKPWMRTAFHVQAASPHEWKSLHCPLYVIGASKDEVTPAGEAIENLIAFHRGSTETFEHVVIPDAGHACIAERPQLVCGLIGDFISTSVDAKLSLGWQLAFFASQSDKWSLKNEAKWRSVLPVGDRVGSAPLRGMKTLRQTDEAHSPALVEKNYPDITDIIDISHEAPPYEPSSFTRIRYHKFPTVSKIPPTAKEVKSFIKLVDKFLADSDQPDPVVAVHCHYGFNRTGFFICSYLIEKLHVGIDQAVKLFKESRPPGIKHPHFIDELYVRYELRDQ